jgi:hypothetical protein
MAQEMKRYKDGKFKTRPGGRQSGGRWKNEQRRTWTDADGIKREGVFDAVGRKVPRQKAPHNEAIDVSPSDWYVADTYHPTQGMQMRCHLCGEWAYRTPLGVEWEDGANRIRWTAEAAGDEGGGFKSRRAVLWAMHVEKKDRFIARHELPHGPTAHVKAGSLARFGWPEYDYLREPERVSPPDLVGRRERPDPLKWDTDWIRWFRHQGQVWQMDPQSRIYVSKNGAKRCPRATLDEIAPPCRLLNPKRARAALEKGRRKKAITSRRDRDAETARQKLKRRQEEWDPNDPQF